MSTFTGTPVRKNTRSSVDMIGQLVGMYRLPGESLADFKERIIDNYIHRGGATYQGLYNGISRQLGLDAHAKGILVDVARDANGAPLNNTFGIEVTSRYLTLYSDHANGTVGMQFDLYDRTGNYFVSDLIAAIDAVSGWEAVNVNLDNYDKSQYLFQQSSLKQIDSLRLTQSRVQNLNSVLLESYFLVGNIYFSIDSEITDEVLTTPSSANEFMVDYDNNVIFLGTVTTGEMTFQYQQLPLLLKWSPVSINSFNDTEYLDLITEQILDEDNVTIDGIPTSDGARLINELLAVAPNYWGK